MYENSNELIRMLKAFLFEEKYTPPTNVDMASILGIARLHSVGAMVSAVITNNDIDVNEDLKKKLKFNTVQCGMLGAMREKLFNEISNAMTNAGIENIIVKGYVLRELYPIKDLRTMTDLDFVIRSRDGNRMEEVMADLGYEAGEVLNGDWDFFKNKMHVEFHERLTESELGNGFDYDDYLKDCFDHTVEYRGLTRALNNEYHLIYMFIHCAKHFYNGGCGFRLIMDFAAYLKCYNNILDWDYVNNELKKIRLYEFSINVWYLCQRWFGITPMGREYSMNDELYTELLGFMARGGTFGEADHNRMISKTARETIEKGSKNPISAFWIKLRSLVLLDDKSMRGIFPWYKNKPKFLLPAAWVYKAVFAIKGKGLNVTKEFMTAGGNNEDVVREYNMLKELGLYRK